MVGPGEESVGVDVLGEAVVRFITEVLLYPRYLTLRAYDHRDIPMDQGLGRPETAFR